MFHLYCLILMDPCGHVQKVNEIEGGLSVEELDSIDDLSAVIKDFMVLLSMVCTDTVNCKSFGELSDALDMIFRMHRAASRIGAVRDRYDVEDSTKSAERVKRGIVHTQEIQNQSTITLLRKQNIKMLSNPRNKENTADFLYND